MMFDAQQIAALQERDFITRAAARLEGACGQEIVQAMQDPEICEIMLNCDGLLFVEVIGSGMQEAGCVDRQAAFTIAKTLASLTGQVLDPEHPLLGAEIPFNGSRIEIQIPPVVKAPSFTIRKHNALDLPLASLIDAQMLTSSQADLLRQAADSSLVFTIHTRDGSQNIPYSAISYIEARGRKLYLRLDQKEIGFAGTLEKLEQDLPPNFCRTHRGFIVNADKIRQVCLTENLVLLWNGLAVPLSRSYKKNVKELHHA